MLVNLAVALSKTGCRCIVGVFRDSRSPHTEIADRARAEGLEVELIPCTGRFDPQSVASIRRLMTTHQVDVLHTHGYKADIYACVAGIGTNAALVATCHNWLGRSWGMRAYAALDRFSMRAFDRIVVVSEAVAATLLHSGIRSSKVETIANGIDVQRFRNAPPTLESDSASNAILGFVGRLVPEKGGEVLLRATQVVLRKHPRMTLAIIGEGPTRQEWESLATTLGIRKQVIFTGARDDMPGVYASLHGLVLPSLCEAMPMCVIEAMAASKPVIATRVGAVPRLVDPEQAGILIEPSDVDALAAAMIRLLDEPLRAQQMGKKGYARASEQFSSDSMAEKYLDLYRKVSAYRQCSRRNTALIPTV